MLHNQNNIYFCFNFVLVSWEVTDGYGEKNDQTSLIYLTVSTEANTVSNEGIINLKDLYYVHFSLIGKKKKIVWELKDCFVFSALGTLGLPQKDRACIQSGSKWKMQQKAQLWKF